MWKVVPEELYIFQLMIVHYNYVSTQIEPVQDISEYTPSCYTKHILCCYITFIHLTCKIIHQHIVAFILNKTYVLNAKINQHSLIIFDAFDIWNSFQKVSLIWIHRRIAVHRVGSADIRSSNTNLLLLCDRYP